LEVQFAQLKSTSADENARQQQLIDFQTKQSAGYKKQLKAS
jgi:hypothetical protein